MTAAAAIMPMMDPIEWSQLLGIVHAIAPRRMIEWGSGGSTRAFLLACPFIYKYVCVEHDRAWYERVRGAIEDPRLVLLHVPPDLPVELGASPQLAMAWDDEAEADPRLMPSYVNAPRRHLEEADLVFVDGRARNFCIRMGFSMLRPGGVLLLHDAQRPEYHAALREVGSPVFLEPFKAGQVALVRKPL